MTGRQVGRLDADGLSALWLEGAAGHPPLLRHTHPTSEALCGECATRVEDACEALVGNLLVSFTHAPPEASVCPVPDARQEGWVLVLRLNAAGRCAARHAYGVLAGMVEAGSCPEHRGPLGDPLIAGLLTARPTAVPGAGRNALDEATAEGMVAAQRYLTGRAADVLLTDGPDLPGLAADRLWHTAPLIGLVILAMAAAAAPTHPGLGPGHLGPALAAAEPAP